MRKIKIELSFEDKKLGKFSVTNDGIIEVEDNISIFDKKEKIRKEFGLIQRLIVLMAKSLWSRYLLIRDDADREKIDEKVKKIRKKD